MTETDGKLRARLALPCRRTPALICCRQSATCPAWLSAASTSARCEACFGVPAATCARYRRRARLWNICRRVEQRGAHQAFSLTAMIILRPARAEKGLVRTGTALGWPPLARTGITPVIPESAGPSALCYFEATGPTYAILRPSARPVYALFLEPAPPMRCS